MERFAGAASWNLEQSYESKPRTLKNKKQKKESNRLPIKTPTGNLIRPAAAEDADSDASDREDAPSTPAPAPAPAREPTRSPTPEGPKKPEKQRVVEAKEELARIASLVQEDPEEHVGLVRGMRTMTRDHNPTIQRLALVATMAVYKDIIPGYRIRPLTDEEQKVKVSKEVKKLRTFEHALLSGYKEYLDQLLGLLRKGRKPAEGESEREAASKKKTAETAVRCAAGLLEHVTHFNFRTEILKMLVETVSVRGDAGTEMFGIAVRALEGLYREDEDGHATLEAVGMVTRMLKGKGYRVHESVLNTFLSLRLLSELDVKGSDTTVEGTRKRKKKEREFRTKKARKQAKEQAALEKELREADAIVSHEEREKMQSETLKLVFVTYFKILRDRPEGLMAATLEGLAKFAHLINLDFFGDLLVALREIVEDAQREEVESGEVGEETRNAVRESLLCVITAFTLLQQQGEKMLPVDLTFFTNHLYATLLPLSLDPDIEFSHKSLRLPDPLLPAPATKRINVATEIEMLIRALDALLFKQNQHVAPQRVMAFTKRLMTSTLQFPEKSAVATLGMVVRAGKKYRNKVEGLWNSEESVGDGVYRGDVDEPERSNPAAATVWEMVLLEKHYSPLVVEATKGLAKEFRGEKVQKVKDGMRGPKYR